MTPEDLDELPGPTVSRRFGLSVATSTPFRGGSDFDAFLAGKSFLARTVDDA
ncbi:hypothetical protein HBB16_13855 [Pseudonocardia sp. MCCB 268]|nr:hypothetical protein [Pseudonocardia cytotoxica]